MFDAILYLGYFVAVPAISAGVTVFVTRKVGDWRVGMPCGVIAGIVLQLGVSAYYWGSVDDDNYCNTYCNSEAR